MHAPPDPRPPTSPYIDGLFKDLPPLETEWSIEDRVRWLRLAVHVFATLYGGEPDEIQIVPTKLSEGGQRVVRG